MSEANDQEKIDITNMFDASDVEAMEAVRWFSESNEAYNIGDQKAEEMIMKNDE